MLHLNQIHLVHPANIEGGLRLGFKTVQSDYVITIFDCFIQIENIDSSFALQLPDAVGIGGQVYLFDVISNAGYFANLLPVVGQTIEGLPNVILSSLNPTYKIISNNKNWRIF